VLSLKGMKFGRDVVPDNPKDALPNQT